MPKRAIISDIHSNLEALTAVLNDINEQSITEVTCLGDIVGYGPNPCECIDLVMQLSCSVLGNHDQGALFDPEGFSSGAERAIFWSRKQLEETGEPEQRKTRWRFLSELPRHFHDGPFSFVHGSARNPLNEYVFPEDIYNTTKLERIFGMIQQYCFQGHTHVPGIFTESGKFYRPSDVSYEYELGSEKVMVNVGSVGQPRDGIRDSSYAVLSDEGISFRRVSYDIGKTAEKIYEISELDNFLGDRLREGR